MKYFTVVSYVYHPVFENENGQLPKLFGTGAHHRVYLLYVCTNWSQLQQQRCGISILRLVFSCHIDIYSGVRRI